MIDEKIKKEQKDRRKEGETGDESEAKVRWKEKCPPGGKVPEAEQGPDEP